MHNLAFEMVQCPYCGEQIEIAIDCSVAEQDYIEDCSVCCRPINFSLATVDGEVAYIGVQRDDD